MSELSSDDRIVLLGSFDDISSLSVALRREGHTIRQEADADLTVVAQLLSTLVDVAITAEHQVQARMSQVAN